MGHMTSQNGFSQLMPHNSVHFHVSANGLQKV
jgi:hypothetical protein